MKKHNKGRARTPKPGSVPRDSHVLNLGAREYLLPFNSDEYKGNSLYVIGYAKCPDCNQKVQLVNDQGLQGNAIFDYAAEHRYPAPSERECVGSRKRPLLFSVSKK